MSASLIAVLTTAAVVVAVVVGVAGGVLVAEVQAQDAADAAALAAAHATRTSDDARRAGVRAASAHGATLVRCDCSGPTVRVVVDVAVASRAARLAGIMTRRADASATLVPMAAADNRRQKRKLSRSRRRTAPVTRWL